MIHSVGGTTSFASRVECKLAYKNMTTHFVECGMLYNQLKLSTMKPPRFWKRIHQKRHIPAAEPALKHGNFSTDKPFLRNIQGGWGETRVGRLQTVFQSFQSQHMVLC